MPEYRITGKDNGKNRVEYPDGRVDLLTDEQIAGGATETPAGIESPSVDTNVGEGGETE